MTRTRFWQIPCDLPVYSGAPSLHMYTHILSVSQRIALVGGVCDDSESGGIRCPYRDVDTRWAHEGPGNSRFPFHSSDSCTWLCFTFFGGGFFSFLSSAVTAFFPFLEKVEATASVKSWMKPCRAPCWYDGELDQTLSWEGEACLKKKKKKSSLQSQVHNWLLWMQWV